MRKRRRQPRHRQDVIEWNAELRAALAGLDVAMRTLDGDFRIHAQSDWRHDAALTRDTIEQPKLLLRFHIHKEYLRSEGFRELALRLPYATKQNRASGKSRLL